MSEEKEQLEEVVGHQLRRDGDITSYAQLALNSKRLEDFIMTSEKKFDRLEDRLTRSEKERLEAKQTNWGVLVSAAGVAVILLGLIVYQPLQEVRGLISEHTRDGHPLTVIEKVNTVGENLESAKEAAEHDRESSETVLRERDKILYDAIQAVEDRMNEFERRITANEVYNNIDQKFHIPEIQSSHDRGDSRLDHLERMILKDHKHGE